MNQHLASILAEIFGIRADQVTLELTKDQVGSWDSLKQMDLVMTLEREFGIALEISDIVRMDSVSTIVEVLAGKGLSFEA